MKVKIVIDAEILPKGLRFNINGVKTELTMVNGIVKNMNSPMSKPECVAHTFDILKSFTLGRAIAEAKNEETTNDPEPIKSSGIVTSSG